jgi:hypothetical protein
MLDSVVGVTEAYWECHLKPWEAYWECHLKPWDIAAGVLVVVLLPWKYDHLIINF